MLKIICGYYTVTPEEMKRSIVLNAADEAIVSLIPLASTVVKHTMQLNPEEQHRTHYVNLDSLKPGRYLEHNLIDYFLMLLEERSRNAAVCFAGTIPRIGVLPECFATSDEVSDCEYGGGSMDRNIRSCIRCDWFGWCATRNLVLHSFCLDLIMFPVYYLSLFHALGVINCRKRCIQVYHTLGPDADPRVLRVIRNRCRLVAIYVQSRARGYAQYDEVWKVVILHPGEQTELAGNVSYEEAGVSLCMHAYHLAFGLVPDFAREAFPGFRRRMVRDLMQN